MKVVHLNADRGIHPGRSKGAAVHLVAMREAFRELGHEVLAIDEPDASLLENALQEMHAEGTLELIYERLALNANAGSAFARRHAIPHVIEVNAPLDEEQSRYRASAQIESDQELLGNTLRAADLLLCVSPECARWARSKGASDERIQVAGNGVDARRFDPKRRAESAYCKHIQTSELVLGFHGRLRPWHAFERLVDAAQTLLNDGHQFHLLMVGKGEFKAAIGSRIPAGHWTHIPWVEHDEVGAIVARFDVLPLSYDPDQPCYFSPLKLLEGMAAGAVSVVPDLGDLANTVQHGKAGLVYDPREPDALAKAISSVLVDSELRTRLARAGRRVAQEHSWRSIAAGVIESIGGQKN